MPSRATGLATVITLGLASPALSQTDFTWSDAGSGLWRDGLNWSSTLGGFPSAAMSRAIIPFNALPETIVLDGSVTVLELLQQSPNSTIEGVGNISFTSVTNIDNDGLIIINRDRSNFNQNWFFDGAGDYAITGNGEIELRSNGSTNDAALIPSTNMLTHAATHTIRGSGELRGAWINEGTVISDDPMPGLGITAADFAQTASGMILADGADFRINGSVLRGGTLDTAPGFAAVHVGSTTSGIDDVTIDGLLQIPGENRVLELLSDNTLNGTIEVNSSLQVFNAVVRAAAPVTINGAGQLVLRTVSNTNDAVIDADIFSVVLGPDIDVSGSGELHGPIVLEGVLTSDDPAMPIRLLGDIDLSLLGQIITDGGDVVLANGSSLSNATVKLDSGGRLKTGGISSTITDSTNQGEISVEGSGHILLALGSLTNNGTVFLNPNAAVFNATLDLAGTTIDGTGEFVLLSLGDINDARIRVADLTTATFGPNQIIRGSGAIADNGDGVYLSQAEIRADDPAATLRILDTTVDQSAGGQLVADNAILSLRRATIIGGVTTSVGTGIITSVAESSTLIDLENTGDLGVESNGNTALIFDGTVENNGRVLVNSNDEIFNCALQLSDGSVTSGVGEIVMKSLGDIDDARLEVFDLATATIGPGQVVRGSGRVRDLGEGVFILNGEIRADDPAVVLRVENTTVDMTGGGLLSGDNAKLSLENALFLGGTTDSVGGGIVAVTDDTVTMLDVTNTGDLGVESNGNTFLVLDGTAINNGRIFVNSNDEIFNCALQLSDGSATNGTGEIIMKTQGDISDARLEVFDLATATIGSGQVVRGSGRVRDLGDGVLNLEGEIRADDPAFLLRVEDTTVDMTGGGLLSGDNAKLSLENALFLGGTTNSVGGGIVAVTDDTVTMLDVLNTGDLGIESNGSTFLVLDGTAVNNGRILVNSNVSFFNCALQLAENAVVTGSGEISLTLSDTDISDARLEVPVGSATIGPDQLLTGSGRMTGDLLIQGEVSPGMSIGEFVHVSGLLSLGTNATLSIELAGPTAPEHDRITGNGDKAVDGDLVVTLIDGYMPLVGDSYEVVAGSAVTGEFASVTFPATALNRVYKIFYEADRVLVVHTCQGDFAEPFDVLNFNDVVAFLTFFSNQDALADLSPPFGVFNFNDVIVFLTEFANGCP